MVWQIACQGYGIQFSDDVHSFGSGWVVTKLGASLSG
jgi:hypothetical protein